MNFDKGKLTDPRAKKWLQEKLEFEKEQIEDQFRDWKQGLLDNRPEHSPNDVKPEMDVSDIDEFFMPYYEFKYLARDLKLNCFMKFANDEHDDLISCWPKTIHGHAVMIQHILQKYDKHMHWISGLDSLSAVRKAWEETNYDIVSMMKYEHSTSIQKQIENLLQPETEFERMGLDADHPGYHTISLDDAQDMSCVIFEIRRRFCQSNEMDLNYLESGAFRVKKDIFEYLEQCLGIDPFSGMTGLAETRPIRKQRDKLFAEIKTVGDMMAEFDKLKTRMLKEMEDESKSKA